jgi:hypothetical protein
MGRILRGAASKRGSGGSCASGKPAKAKLHVRPRAATPRVPWQSNPAPRVRPRTLVPRTPPSACTSARAGWTTAPRRPAREEGIRPRKEPCNRNRRGATRWDVSGKNKTNR